MTDDLGKPGSTSNVLSFDRKAVRKRIVAAIEEALVQHPPLLTDEVKQQMAAIGSGGLVFAQIRHGFKRAEFTEVSEKPVNARVSFTARMVSAGEEFFVRASVQMIVPYAGMFVVINRVWR